jgi:hypothetical protein
MAVMAVLFGFLLSATGTALFKLPREIKIKPTQYS